MPAHPNRLLHGMGHPRLPSQVTGPGAGASPRTPTGTPASSIASTPGAVATVTAQAAPVSQRRQIIPVSVMDAFYQMLPSPNIQQQSISKENKFAAQDLDDGLVIGSVTTRTNQVYIWTNIMFYALTPGAAMNAPPVQLTERQLSGLIRFDLTIDNTSPMNLIAASESPYTDPLFVTQGDLAGWQTLNRDFGSSRYGSAFALYARSQQVTNITMRAVQRGRYPRFVIDRVGFELHGYVASEGEFDTLWRKNVG